MDLPTTPPTASASASAPGVSSSSESQNSPRKIRSACDRCHGQKLRCIRKEGQVSCERCLKLHTTCRFGPRASRTSLKRPKSPARWVQGEEQEPLSASASIPTPNAYSNEIIADRRNSDWWFPLGLETSIATGPG